MAPQRLIMRPDRPAVSVEGKKIHKHRKIASPDDDEFAGRVGNIVETKREEEACPDVEAEI